MLTRVLIACGLVTACLIITSPGAIADTDPVDCPPTLTSCLIIVTGPGAPGSRPTPGASTPPSSRRVCHWPGTGEPMDCQGPFGWWSETDRCFYQQVQPQPAASAPFWDGHYPDGAIYASMCPGAGGTGGGWVWFASPPNGYGGRAMTPADLAVRAVKLLPIQGPVIGMAPRPGSVGLVGLPVWMWTAVSARTWGPASATASVPGMSVTATARAQKVVWDMGDGHAVTCTSPGTVYTIGRGGGDSPTCGYLYQWPSGNQPGGKYVVTATTTWAVTWAGGGASGSLTVTRASSLGVVIGELQVVVT